MGGLKVTSGSDESWVVVSTDYKNRRKVITVSLIAIKRQGKKDSPNC